MVSEPAVGGVRPARRRRTVVLPQPLGPMRATKSPGAAVRVRSARTSGPESKRLLTASSVTRAV